jgi:hypothetical protein
MEYVHVHGGQTVKAYFVTEQHNNVTQIIPKPAAISPVFE